MIRKKNYILMLVFLVLGTTTGIETVLGQGIESDIAKGFSNSNPELIVKHLDSDAKIIIKPESYSPNREEAIQILKDFFRLNPVIAYENKFNSGKSNSNFMIIILRTRDKSFRVTLFFISSGDERKINLLRIEQENE